MIVDTRPFSSPGPQSVSSVGGWSSPGYDTVNQG